jgi:hypothetical protein
MTASKESLAARYLLCDSLSAASWSRQLMKQWAFSLMPWGERGEGRREDNGERRGREGVRGWREGGARGKVDDVKEEGGRGRM